MYFWFNSILAIAKTHFGKETAFCTCTEFPSDSKHMRYALGSQRTLEGSGVLVSCNCPSKQKGKCIRFWWDILQSYTGNHQVSIKNTRFSRMPQMSPERIEYISYWIQLKFWCFFPSFLLYLWSGEWGTKFLKQNGFFTCIFHSYKEWGNGIGLRFLTFLDSQKGW